MKKCIRSIYQPIRKCCFIKKDKGVVLIVTLLLMLAISVIGVGVAINANLNASVAKNYIGKLQSFYAADAQVALLSQEVFDGNADKYLNSATCSGSPNVITNCDFSGGTSPWVTWNNGGVCSGSIDNGRYHLVVTDGGTEGENWHAEFAQKNLPLTASVTYLSRFDARCNASRIMYASVTNAAGSTAFSGWLRYYMTTSMQTYWSYFVKDAGSSVADASLWFQAGGQGPLDLWVDNVFLAPVSSNPDFNLAFGKTMTSVGGDESGYPPSLAGDAVISFSSRWSSAHADDKSITVDLGQRCLVQAVVLKWESWATNYEILLSTDNNSWYQAYQNTSGVGGNEVVTFSPQIVRYVRMHGITRGTVWGFSLYEFEVYGSVGGRSGNGKKVIGEDSVAWSLKELIPSAGFNIIDTAFAKSSGAKKTYNSQLGQYVEIPSGGLVNPFGAKAKIPITYYDFRSNRSNPEFEMRHKSLLRKGMVGTTLDGARKPVLGTSPYLNYGIGRWFKTWAAPDRNNIPSYTYVSGGEWDAVITYAGSGSVGYDTTFKNIPFQDTLILTHIGNGMYQYANDAFFPLDTRGFGKEWNYAKSGDPSNPAYDHNYSFTMEMKTTFTKVPGQKFYFNGDDDVWVFINNHLEMDLGGVHQRTRDSIIVDNLGLTTGSTYNFDFFYCERHSSEAHIEIMTNLLTYHQFTSKRIQWKRSYGNIN